MPASGPPRTIRVAIVEDDPVFRSAFAAAIAAATDMQLVGVAANQREGLALLGGLRADVLLVDLGLPDGSGVEVIHASQAAWPGCSAVVTTALGDEQHVMRAIRAGAAGYLLKDSSPGDIASEIRTVAAGGSPISPLIARRVMALLRGSEPAAGAGQAPGRAEPEVALSARETEVLKLVAMGYAYHEIAQRLEVSRHTVLTFVRRIYAKLEVRSKMEAVNVARRQGLLAD